MIGVSFKACGAEQHNAFKDAKFYGGRYYVLYPSTRDMMKSKMYQDMWAEEKIRHLYSWNKSEPLKFECQTVGGERLRIETHDVLAIRMSNGEVYTGDVLRAENNATVTEYLEGKDDWYIEISWHDGMGYGYWKQQYDGGKIIAVNGTQVK